MEDDCPVRIFLLGNLKIETPAGAPALRRKSRALLAYLAAEATSHSRQALAELLCSETEDPLRTLRLLLSRLRSVVGPDRLQTDDSRVALDHSQVWVDSRQVERLLDHAHGAPPLQPVQRAVGLYRGEFLAGLALPDAPDYELWLLHRRTHFQLRYEAALLLLVDHLIARDAYQEALPHAQRLVETNPLAEEANARLIWLLAYTGSRAAALAHWQHFRLRFEAELGVEPGHDLMALRDAIQAGRLRPPRSTAPLPLPPRQLPQADDFVQRDAELAQLDHWLRLARAGAGQVVLIEAEAGGGKSRLVEEWQRSHPEAHLLAGRCYESTRSLPYHPWIEIGHTHLAARPHDEPQRLTPFVRRYLAQLLPGLAARIHDPAPQPPLSGEELQRLFVVFADWLLEPCSPDTPCVIFLDDLHWADGATLMLFHFFAARLARRPLLLIGCYRSEEVAGGALLQTLLHEIGRLGAHTLSLRPLEPEAIHQLATRLWPALPDGYRPHLVHLIASATRGNPLFVSAVLRELSGSSRLPHALPVPSSVQELVRHRMRQLPEASRQVLEALSVFGRPAALRMIQETSGRGEDETALALERALAAGWVRPAGEAGASYTFYHDLVREAVTRDLSALRLARLHGRAAASLARWSTPLPAALREDVAGRIVRHAEEAGAMALVLTWAPLAATRAVRLGSLTDARTYYETEGRAWEALRLDPDWEEAAYLHAHIETRLGYLRLLDVLKAPLELLVTVLGEVAAYLERAPDERLRVYYRLAEAGLLSYQARLAEASEAALAAHAQLLTLGAERDAALALFQAGNFQITIGNNRVGQRHLEQALALYRRSGTLADVITALGLLTLCDLNFGEVEAARARLWEALGLNQPEHPPSTAYLLYTRAVTNAWYYDTEGARRDAEQARRLYDEVGVASFRATMMIGVADFVDAANDRARAALEPVFSAAQIAGDTWCEGFASHFLGRIALEAGLLEEAEHWLRHSLARRRANGEQHNQIASLAWLGRLLLAQGHVQEALAHTSEAMERIDALRDEAYPLELCDMFMAHAEALAANGEAELARHYVAQAYRTMMAFAAGIAAPEDQRSYLAYRLHQRIRRAWEERFPQGA